MLSQKPKQVHTWAKVDGTFATFPGQHIFLLFSQEFVCPDFCPNGIIEGYFQEDSEGGGSWIGSVWNGQQDCWDAKVVRPTHYSLQPEPPMFVQVHDEQSGQDVFRFRLVKGSRHSEWARYADIAFLDGMAAMSGYYAGAKEQELVPLPAEEVLKHIAVGEKSLEAPYNGPTF